ncbi:SCO5555 family protein [Flindersiella endophytica]
MSEDPNTQRDFVDLAHMLKAATKRLREAVVSPDERARLTRKLLVIASASKHDLASARRRLQGLLAELKSAEEAQNDSETPRHKEH